MPAWEGQQMTLTDLANIVLEDLGQKAIGNIDGEDFNARRMKRRIYNSIQTVAKKRNWICLQTDIQLTQAAGKGVCGEYKYIPPKNLINIIASTADWKRSGDYILSASPELTIRCTILTFEPDQWSVNLQNAVIAQLKQDMTFAITGDAQLAGQVYQLAERAMKTAIMDDALDEKCRRVQKRTSWFNGW